MKIDYMKRLLMVVLVAAIIFVSGCSSQVGDSGKKVTAKESASDFFKAYLENAKKITSMEIEYTTQIGGITANGKDYISGDRSASNIEIILPDGKSQMVKAYVFGSELHSCIKSGDGWTCGKQQLNVPLSKDAQINTLDEMYKKGAITFGGDIVEKTINNIKCKEVLWSVEIGKLSQEEKYFILAASGMTSVSNIDQLTSGLKSFGMTQCITEEGVEILQDISTEVDKNKINLKTEVTSFKINQPIDEKVFAVPDKSATN